MAFFDPNDTGILRLDKEHIAEFAQQMPEYKLDCMQGYGHPLEIEKHKYTLLEIHRQYVEEAATDRPPGYLYEQFNKHDLEFINQVSRRPEVEWALHNSFDGLYVQKYRDPSRYEIMFRFAAYLKEEHATFWKLKYNGK